MAVDGNGEVRVCLNWKRDRTVSSVGWFLSRVSMRIVAGRTIDFSARQLALMRVTF